MSEVCIEVKELERIFYLNAWLLNGGDSGTFTTLKPKFTAVWQLLQVLVNKR